MKFNEFVQGSVDFWDRYLRSLSDGIAGGDIRLGKGMLLFPNIALFTETNDHYVLELFGAQTSFSGLQVKKHKESSTLMYLYQFSPEQEGPTLHLNGRGHGFNTIAISRDVSLPDILLPGTFKERFAFIDRWPSQVYLQGGKGAVLSFGRDFKNVLMNNSLVVNRLGEIYRVKHILYMAIVSKEQSKKDCLEDLAIAFTASPRTTSDLLGVHYCPNSLDTGYVLSGQFANLFLLPGLRETTIGEFINKNPDMIKRAFACERFEYEPEFKWMEGNPDPTESAINPDLMIKRADGYYDICELKTGKLDKKKITKGQHRRRRFIDYVEEGIAQLANYEEYFRFPKNREFARTRYGIEVSEPNLFLIVGNYENAPRNEIEEAARKLKSNYRIIDYDTLNTLFLQSFFKIDL
jgi:hypothetical protein